MQSLHINVETASRLIVFELVAILAGCSSGLETDYSKLGLVDVSGTVTLDGEPVAGVQVIFEEDERHFSYATTDASGEYELMFNSEKSGITPGPKTVRISSAAAQAEEGEEMTWETQGESDPNAEGFQPRSESIPACYNRDTKLSVVVEDGSQTFDFALKSDCSTTGPT